MAIDEAASRSVHPPVRRRLRRRAARLDRRHRRQARAVPAPSPSSARPTPPALAAATGCDARLVAGVARRPVRLRLLPATAPQTGTYWLSPEQAAVLADPSSPAFLVGAMTIAASTAKDEEKVREAFTHRCGPRLARAPPRPVPRHRAAVQARLRRQPRLGSGSPRSTASTRSSGRAARSPTSAAATAPSTILLAQAYPNATITGFDYHQASIDIARKRAAEAGVADRVRFEVASAQDFPGDGYDLVCIFDALHDMGDPLAAARHIRQALDADGTWLLVEPMAGESLEDNVNPVGRIFYAASTFICTPGGPGPARRLRARRPGPRGHASPSSSPAPGSAGSAARPRPRSTGSSKPAPEPARGVAIRTPRARSREHEEPRLARQEFRARVAAHCAVSPRSTAVADGPSRHEQRPHVSTESLARLHVAAPYRRRPLLVDGADLLRPMLLVDVAHRASRAAWRAPRAPDATR